MTELLATINQMMEAPEADIADLERTLTDGYAHALSLEAEQLRLEKQIAEVTEGLHKGDAKKKAAELLTLARRLDGKTGELARLRARLAELRRRADEVREAARPLKRR
jgi:chromosome segregation ATPase